MVLFTDEVRKYPLQDTLLCMSKLSLDIFENSKASGCPFGILKETLHITVNHFVKKHELLITIWNLIDISYYAILNSNDYKCSKKFNNRAEAIHLVGLFHDYCNIVDGDRPFIRDDYSDPNLQNDFMLYFYGFLGEQMQVQTVGTAFNAHAREEYIIKEISPKFHDGILVEEIFQSKFGISSKELSTILLALFGISTIQPEPLAAKWFESGLLSKQNIAKIVDYYSVTYKDVRDSDIGRQILLSKPYIKTDKGTLIVSNIFALLFLYKNSTFWTIRDYYREKKSQAFVNAFGDYFELYFQETLEEYLKPEQFFEIPESNTKRADWYLTIGGFRFLIEQKSALIGITAKQQNSDLNSIKTYITRHLFKAMKQLHHTECEINDGKIIKIILLYDNYFMSEVLDCAFKMVGVPVEDDNYYWLVTIDELERLLYIYSVNERDFFDIINEKIEMESNKSNDGRSLIQIITKHGYNENMHLKKDKFKEYLDIEKDLIKQVFNGREIYID